jgi:hypothetical protein
VVLSSYSDHLFELNDSLSKFTLDDELCNPVVCNKYCNNIQL